MKVISAARVVLVGGIIAESIVMSSGYAYSAADDYRDSSGFPDLRQDMFDADISEEGPVFAVDTPDDLRRAFDEQALELNEMFFLKIKSSFDVKAAMQERDMGFVHCQWKLQYPLDKDGNSSETEYLLYMFIVEYRDDIKVLQAYKNNELAGKLTDSEAAMKKKAESIIAAIIKPDMGEYEKVLAIHDYIILNGKYSPQSDDPVIQESLHKAEGILMYGTGICSSYSSSMCLLLGMVDIDCIFVTGIGQNKNGLSALHSWNKVNIDGMWYNIDVTWNDPTPDKAGVVSYEYFGMTDEALSASHMWNREAYPPANSSYYNYYRYNGLLSRDYAQFKSIISKGIEAQKNNREINVRLYVENYDPNVYDLNFVFDSLSGAEKASFSKLSGPCGEFTLIIQMSGGAEPSAPYMENASAWAREGIGDAYRKGFIPDEIQNTYQSVITRREFCRMAVKWVEYTMGKDIGAVLTERGLTLDTGAFTDTNDPYILAAYALGITSSVGGGRFAPNEQVTREQAAVMIMNVCRVAGADTGSPSDSGFADLGDASSWAVNGINFVRAKGIMSGTGGNNFSPQAVYTREQSIVTFNNIKAGGR
jgi:hypothetical protein